MRWRRETKRATSENCEGQKRHEETLPIFAGPNAPKMVDIGKQIVLFIYFFFVVVRKFYQYIKAFKCVFFICSASMRVFLFLWLSLSLFLSIPSLFGRSIFNAYARRDTLMHEGMTQQTAANATIQNDRRLESERKINLVNLVNGAASWKEIFLSFERSLSLSSSQRQFCFYFLSVSGHLCAKYDDDVYMRMEYR